MTNNNNYKELMKINERTHEIKTRFVTDIVTSMKAFYNEQFVKIQSNKELSPLGKRSRVDGLKLNLACEGLSYCNEAKSEYIKLAARATELAKAIKAEELTPPSEIDQKLFENDFVKLKLNVALGVTAQKSLEKLGIFASQYVAEPFFSAKILEDFGEIVSRVLAINNSPHTRFSLQKIKDGLEAVAISPQIESANAALSIYANVDKFRLFKSETIQYKAIKQMLGGQLASKLLVDDYAVELEKIDAEIAELVAKGGND